ncbi:MAG: hypothetical protein GX039_08765 [Clostridia bacterium]|nr:hypothetical protein [Clostridia bacterium]
MDMEIYGISAVLLIMGIVQLAKNAGFPSKFAGLLAVAIGILASVGYTMFQEAELFRALVTGIALGLAAAGLYSTQKNVRGY